MKTPVTNILRRKGAKVVTIEPTATVFEAIQRMVEANVGAIVVTQDDEIVGIFTERDYLRRIVIQGRTSKTTNVEEVMTNRVITIDKSYSVEDCLAIMTEHKCRHLPVVHDGKLVGIVSIGDCVRELHAASAGVVQHLTHYISGHYPV
jgi:CBS domain-containing protein